MKAGEIIEYLQGFDPEERIRFLVIDPANSELRSINAAGPITGAITGEPYPLIGLELGKGRMALNARKRHEYFIRKHTEGYEIYRIKDSSKPVSLENSVVHGVYDTRAEAQAVCDGLNEGSIEEREEDD